MTILLVIPSLTTGGAEAFVVRLANELSQRHAVHLYLFDEQASLSLRDRLAPTVQLHGRSPRLRLWVDRIRLRLRRLGIRFWTADDVTKYCLRKLCKELHPAVVNTHLYLANAFVAETIDDLGCPQVVTDHGDYRYLSTTGAVTTDELRQSLRGARAIVALCDANMPLLERLAPESTIRKIYNGLEPSALRPIDADRARLDLPDDAIVFGMVARGIPEKGWNEAVEAFEQIDRRVRRACLVLVGESPTLRDLAANYTHDPDIKFVGWAAD
ncbi:MAG TPA: glycosyltransferase, partial [Pirellulales bacterium]|nr:glycosyltransferase [Pirellulales bacterium]